MVLEWVGRIFSPATRPEPAWMGPDAPIAGDELLTALLGAIGGPYGARAAERLREVVHGLRMAERVRVDERVRRQLSRYWSQPLPCAGTPEDVRRLALPPGTEAAVLGLLASLPSGYLREAAVQRLALLGTGDELAPLLVRANDWVAPVRARALDALHARLVPDYAPHWVAALPLVLRLRGTGRGEARPLVEGVLARLRAPGSRDAVLRGMGSADRTVRRACFRILRDAGGPGLPALIADALLGADEIIRLEAVHAAADLDDAVLRGLLPRMLADRFGRVRGVALGLAAERLGPAALPALREALLDRRASLRAAARAALARLEPMDAAAYYRARMGADAPRLDAAVAGLAETGGAEDADTVAPLLSHPRPRVRAAALRALARLAGDASVPGLVRALGDASSSVSRAAADALRPRVVRADASALAAWYGRAHAEPVRRNALSLLAARGKWDGLAWILQACADADPPIRAAGLRHLQRWRQRFNRSFSQPTPAQQERIRAALDEGGADALEAETVRWVRFAAGVA